MKRETWSARAMGLRAAVLVGAAVLTGGSYAAALAPGNGSGKPSPTVPAETRSPAVASSSPAGSRVAASAPESPTAAPFWSLEGHDIVCEIALQRLTQRARDLVDAVRAQDPDPGPNFRRSCAWPDASRYEDHKATYEYHFMNLVVPDAPQLVMQRDCANYDCVQLAIVRYARYLSMDPGDSESMQIRRANALKFASHFVGDLHQPVHVGYAHDRGANDVYVDFFDQGSQRLHAVWDSYIPQRMGLYDDPLATARRLNDEITGAEAAEWANFDVVAWSRESYEVVKTLVYDYPESGRIGDAYFDRAAPIVERRFKQAGVRLAYLINNAAAGTLDFPPLFQ